MRTCEFTGCNKPVFGTCKITKKGFCHSHQFARLDTDKRSILQKAQDKSKQAPLKESRVFVRQKEDTPVMGGNSAELNRWFNDRRLELTGVCHNCGKPSCKNDDKYFKFSICHILPKAYVKSVATNPFNFLELCFWGENSCHSQLDNCMLDLIQLSCFDEVVVKFQKMYPSIAPNERRRIPDVLLQYIGTDF